MQTIQIFVLILRNKINIHFSKQKQVTCWFFFLLLSIQVFSSVSAEPVAIQSERVALVIGNASYANGMLLNPVNDARAVAAKLEILGFRVLLRENLNREAMYSSLNDFSSNLKAGGVALFYYAGHGMQIDGKNFLIPVDKEIQREDDIEFRGFDANQVLARMEKSRSRVNMMVLDACRNNPFARNNRSASNGLAQMEAPKGTLIAFSTAPGKLAKDGSGSNSIYTRNFVEKLSTPAMPVEEIFKEVRIAVVKETNEQQTPWESTSLMGNFYFVPPNATAKFAPAQLASIAPQGGAASKVRSLEPEEMQTLPLEEAITDEKTEAKKTIAKKVKHDYNREGYEIEKKARNITSDDLPELIAKAEEGDEVAQTTLGWAYMLGKGQLDGRNIPRSNKEVVKWTTLAANKGYPVAQNNLGAMYAEGALVKLDFQKARHYYKLAADQGYLTAQVNLLQVSARMGGTFDTKLLGKINQAVQRQIKQPVK